MIFFKDLYHLAKKILFSGLVSLLPVSSLFAQSGSCDGTVPVYYLDLTGAPDSIWSMPNVMRDGTCCSYNHPPNSCVKFIVTLDPASQGITFNVTDGAVPGNLEWQLMNPAQDACDPTTYPAGVPVCLDGVGPHVIIFCKPGGNNNTYTITSIQAPSVSGDFVLNDGCSGSIQVLGYNVATLFYNTVYPGAVGSYNNILSCTSGCSTVNITGQPGYPPYVDVQVCGMPLGTCYTSQICDTVRVFFNPNLTANINPINPTICYGSTTTNVTAVGAGGSPPYSYLWSTGSSAQTISIGVGTYSVTISDVTNCSFGSASVNVTGYTSSISANAGSDQMVCTNNFPVQLTGTVSGVTGGIWTGGNGTILPSPTSLIITYTPSAQEITNGGFSLNLTTTGNGSCPSDADTVNVSILAFQASLIDSTDISCNGANDGNVTAFANTGSPPVTYLWSNGNTNAINNGLSGGNYTITIIDNAGCNDIFSVYLSEPPPITATISSTTTPCMVFNATAEVVPSGGVPGYIYQWNDPGNQTTQIATGLGAGYFNVTVTDMSNCSQVFGVGISNDGPPDVIISDSVMVSCFNGNDGSATSVITNPGVPPHTYLWSDILQQTTAIASGLTAGTYFIIVTDSLNCIGSAQVTITEPAAIISTTQSQNTSCFGLADGTASVSASGGAPPYSFIWSNGQGLASIIGLAQGKYHVTVSDYNNCQQIDSVYINEPLAISTIIGNIQNVSCYGLTDGSATIIGNNGTPPYSYLWSTGQSTSTISNLSAGIYIVTISDANGCSAVLNVTISQPGILNISGSTVNVLCHDSTTGSIDITVSGGTSPFLYGWSDGAVTEDLFSIGAGNYVVTIIDANNCSSSQSFTVTQPNAITISSDVNPISCFGAGDGSINISVSGGTSAYNYSWSNGSINSNINNLQQGSYQLTVTDANFCSATTVNLINEPSLFSASITFTSDYNGYGIPCYGDTLGFINLYASGGVLPYSFLWSNNTSDIDLYNVGVGNYSVTLTDAHTCNAFADTVLTQPPQLMVSLALTDVSCYNGTNGSADATISGGVSGYSVTWSTTYSGEDLLNIPAGSYWVQVQDTNNCTFFDSLTINQPNELILTCVSDTIICKNTQAIINTYCTGGTLPYNFFWNNVPGLSIFTLTLSSDTFMSIYVQDNNGCISNTVSSAVFTYPGVNLSVATTDDSVCIGNSTQIIATISGGYSNNYSLFDMNQEITSPYTITPNATQDWIFMAKDSCNVKAWDTITIYAFPVPQIFSVSVSDVLCNGTSTGTIDMTVSGGTPDYSFLWNNTALTEDLFNIPAGSYNVQISDINNCFITDTFIVNEPSELIISGPPDTLICKNNTVNIQTSATGGVTPYTFFWNGAPGVSNLTISPNIDTVLNIYVVDANNCTSYTVITAVNVVPSVQLSVTTANDSICIGSSTQINAGIYGAYNGSYSLYFNNQIISTPYTISPNSTHDWIFMAKDSCNIQAFDTITIYALPNPIITNSYISNVLCFGNATGAINITVSGGTPGYQFLWSTSSTTEDIVNVAAGSYFVQVRDTNNCIVSDTMTISEPQKLLISSSYDTLTCKNSNITLQAIAKGGIPPYLFFWNGVMGISLHTVIPASDTTIYVYAKDANQCNSDSASTDIQIYPNVNITVFALKDTACAKTSVQIIATVSGGAGPPYTLYNENMQLINSPYLVTPINSQYWIITGMDSCRTTASDSVFIYTIPVPTLTIRANVYSGCMPLHVYFIGIAEPEAQNYYWNFGQNNAFSYSHNPEYLYSEEGTYDVSLSVTSNEGCPCILLLSDLITVYPKPESRFLYDPISPSIINPVIYFTNYSTPGTISYWSFGDGDSTGLTDPMHRYIKSGAYNIALQVQTIHGCKDVSYAQIRVLDEFTLYAPSAFSPDYNDINDNFSVYGYGIDPNKFTLYIYDRWGEIIFKTSTLLPGKDGGMYSEPWNGKVNNNSPISQISSYAWLVEYNDVKGAFRSKSGVVVVIR